MQWPVSGLGKGVGGDTFSGIVDLLDMKWFVHACLNPNPQSAMSSQDPAVQPLPPLLSQKTV